MGCITAPVTTVMRLGMSTTWGMDRRLFAKANLWMNCWQKVLQQNPFSYTLSCVWAALGKMRKI